MTRMKLMMMTMVKVLMVMVTMMMVTMMMVMVTGPGSTWPAGTVAVTQFGEKIQIAKSILLLFQPMGGGVSMVAVSEKCFLMR